MDVTGIIWYTVYHRMMGIKLHYVVGNIIEIYMWKRWTLNHVLTKFRCIKRNTDEDIDMPSHINIWKRFQYKILFAI